MLEDLLVRHGVPYQVIGGPRFYERAEIKDAMAYLSVLDNPSDEIALRRIINQPRRGIGDASVDRLSATAGFSGRSLWAALEDPEAAGLGTAAARSVRAFRAMMDDLRDRAVELPVGELMELLLERNGVIELLEAERTIEASGRIENLQELVGVAREYVARSEEPSLAGFLQEVSLTADADALAAADESGGGRVTLMTLHNAKGLEFDAVFVIGMEQNLFPHARSIEEANIEEERRLCYVAITRARRELVLVYARQRTLFGARGFNAPSQFIAEIPENLIEHERRPASFGSTVRGRQQRRRLAALQRRRDHAAAGNRPARRRTDPLRGRQRRARPARRGRRDGHGRRRPGDRALPLRRLGAPAAAGLRARSSGSDAGGAGFMPVGIIRPLRGD